METILSSLVQCFVGYNLCEQCHGDGKFKSYKNSSIIDCWCKDLVTRARNYSLFGTEQEQEHRSKFDQYNVEQLKKIKNIKSEYLTKLRLKNNEIKRLKYKLKKKKRFSPTR